MATSTWSSFCAHTDNATFRIWGKKIHDELVLMSGIVNTADTGQIDWVTTTIPAADGDAGYQIYYLNDAIHATAPLYFRIDFGTAALAATRPRIKLTVGTGTDGAGNLSGPGTSVPSAFSTSISAAATSAVTNYTSYLCVAEGYVLYIGWGGGVTAGAGAVQGFHIHRTRDTNATAAVNGNGATVVTHGGSTTTPVFTQNLRFTSPADVYTRSSTFVPIFVEHAETSTLIGADLQLYLGWHATPEIWPMGSLCGGLASELTAVFSTYAGIALVGTTTHTFMTIRNQMGTAVSVGTSISTSYGSLVLWE